MPTEKLNKLIFVDYVPAELREGKIWYIVYYVRDPISKELTRKRQRVKPMSNTKERRRYGKKLAHQLNRKLERGWNPFYEQKGSRLITSLIKVLNIYESMVENNLKDGLIRKDTRRSYIHYSTRVKEFVRHEELQTILSHDLDEDFVNRYLDHQRTVRGVSAKTRDNHLSWMKSFCNWMISKKYLTTNPTLGIKRINTKTKTRTIIDTNTRDKIFSYWKEKDNNFLTLCLVCYYCLVRRTELTKIKVANVNLENKTLFIDSTESKNKKNAHVTIPDEIIEVLRDHVKDAAPSDLLFGKGYIPGPLALRPNAITKRWSYMRDKLNIPKEIQWYSLKDSGITDLLRAGVPLISVRDQARHSSSAQTDTYTPKDMRTADPNILKSNITFLKN